MVVTELTDRYIPFDLRWSNSVGGSFAMAFNNRTVLGTVLGTFLGTLLGTVRWYCFSHHFGQHFRHFSVALLYSTIL